MNLLGSEVAGSTANAVKSENTVNIVHGAAKNAARTPANTVANIADLDALRFVFVTGKGGVGKTTVAAAMARAMASRGRRVLVAMCNAKERLSAMMGCGAIGHEITHVAPNIDAVNIVPEHAIEEYGMMMLKVRSLYKALFENKYVASFLRAVPGLHEWSMLGKAWFHTTELLSGEVTDDPFPPRGDGWKYETVIVDAPATGHGLDMLRVPKVILDVTPTGPLRKEAERAWRLFQDPTHAGVVLVTLPEEMPANETLELASGIRQLNLPIPRLVVNATLPPLFEPEPRAQFLERLHHLDEDSKAGGGKSDCVLRPARARAVRENIQSAAMQKLQALGIPTTYLPFLVTHNPSDPQAILYLARGF